MTCTSVHMHEEAKKSQAERDHEALVKSIAQEKPFPQQLKNAQDKTRELRQWIAGSIGQLRYAQWLLCEPVHARSQQIDEFIKKLEEAIK